MYKKILILFLFLFLIGNVFALLGDDLNAYYKFDETTGTNAYDSTGNDFNGTANAGDILNNSVGILGTASQYVAGDTDIINYAGTLTSDYPFTQNVWIKATAGAEIGIMGLYNSADSTTMQYLGEDAGDAKAYSYFGGSSGKAVSSESIIDSAWHMVTGIFISDTNRCVAIDGIIKSCDTTSIDFGTFDRFSFGAGNRASIFGYVTGFIDEAGFWSRALTESEIDDLYNGGLGLAYPFSVPDVNSNFIYSINKVDSEIDFNDLSNPTMTTIDDWNWVINDVSVSTDQNFSYTTTAYEDINACLIIDNNDDTLTSTSCQSFNSGSFTGRLTINTFDENSLQPLYNVNINFDGNDYNASNTMDINTPITSATSSAYTFTFSKTGYGTREYSIDLNKYSDVNLDFMLIPEGLGTDIDFRFFMPDRSTKVANTYITVQNWDKDNNYLERKLSDADGDISFNLNVLDGNYHFLFDSYDYNSVALTVNRPRDEETAADIPETWDLTLSGLAAASYQDISETSQLLAIYSNTVDYYILTVSSDSNDPVYLSRKYEMQTTGNPSTLTLQPYLPEADIATAIKIITEQDNGITVTRYPQVTVKIYKTLADEGRSLIEQTITDAKGEAFVSLVAGDTYEFEVYVDGTIIEFYGDTVQLLKVAGSQIVFTINVAQSGASTTDISGVKVGWTPITTGLTLQTTGTKTFTQTITNLNGDPISASVWYYMNGVLIESDFVLGTSSDYTFSADFNWLDLEKGDLNIVVSVTWDGNTYYYSKTYTIATPFGGYYDPIEGLRTGLRSDLACTATGICGPLLAIALILSTGIVVFASIKIGALGTQATAILFGVFLTIFTYLTWVPIELIIVTWVLIFAFIITDRRGS